MNIAAKLSNLFQKVTGQSVNRIPKLYNESVGFITCCGLLVGHNSFELGYELGGNFIIASHVDSKIPMPSWGSNMWYSVKKFDQIKK